MSTRDVIRQAKPKVHALEISGGTVHVRALSGAGRAQYMAMVAKNEKGSTPVQEIAALGLCEEDGTLSYTTEKDIEELAEIDGADLEKIVFKLFEVSGLTKDSSEQAEKK